MKRLQIAIGSDHAGVELKKHLIEFLTGEGYDVLNCGTNSSASVDYPDIAEQVAAEVLRHEIMGILICGTGIGISIAANKIPGIRAAVCQDVFTAHMAREHNDANILALGARVINNDSDLADKITKIFIHTDFLAGRHERRVEKIKALEKKYCERGNNLGLY